MHRDLTIPKTTDFRKWVRLVSRELKMSPYQWSLGAGISQNTLSKFINHTQKDLRLETAALLFEHASSVAREQGQDLPSLPSKIADQAVARTSSALA